MDKSFPGQKASVQRHRGERTQGHMGGAKTAGG